LATPGLYENSLSALAHFSIDFNAFLPHVLVRGFARQKHAGALLIDIID
jgi:hypothetical protein